MVTNIPPTEAAQALSSGKALLIDVREPDEFKTEHIPYALSLPLGQITELFQTLNIPHGTDIIFQCQKGMRGEKACVILSKENCPHKIYNIEGGLIAWKEAGLPLVQSNSTTISLFRQVQIIIGFLILSLVIIGFQGIPVLFAVAGLLGGALFFAGISGWCGLALLLSKMPWNK